MSGHTMEPFSQEEFTEDAIAAMIEAMATGADDIASKYPGVKVSTVESLRHAYDQDALVLVSAKEHVLSKLRTNRLSSQLAKLKDGLPAYRVSVLREAKEAVWAEGDSTHSDDSYSSGIYNAADAIHQLIRAAEEVANA